MGVTIQLALESAYKKSNDREVKIIVSKHVLNNTANITNLDVLYGFMSNLSVDFLT